MRFTSYIFNDCYISWARNLIRTCISKMMWKLLFGLIYIINEISFAKCTPKKSILPATLISEIHKKRESLEQQHDISYSANKVMYRNWPEVHENPKHDCQKFLQIIFPKKTDLPSATARIQKVIIHYTHTKDEDKIVLPPKRVTALECRLRISAWNRRFIYFIRSPQSPKCALFLNPIGKKNLNFYIVEDICEHNVYPLFRKYTVKFEDSDKLEGNTSKFVKKIKPLPHKELKIKLLEFEEKHYEFCSTNPEICKLWPEVQMIKKNECQRFSGRMLSERQDLSLVTATTRSVTLNYIEIKDESGGRLDSVGVKAIACRLPHLILSRRFIYFIRAPSYPSCVFYISQKILFAEHFHISEEVCDTPSCKISLYRILIEHRRGSEFTKKAAKRKYEMSEKLQMYEELHFQDYSVKQSEYKEWPELEELSTTSYCQTLIENICPKIANTFEFDNLATYSEYVNLKYVAIRSLPNGTFTVKTLTCLLPEKYPPNQFRFIRSPEPNCVYWIRRKHGRNNFYVITRKFCKDDVGFSNLQHERTLSIDDDDSWMIDFEVDDEFLDYIHEHVFQTG